MTPPAHGIYDTEDSVRLLLIKNSCFNIGSRGSGRQSGHSLVLTPAKPFKEEGSSFGVTPSLVRLHSHKRLGSVPPPRTHDVHPRVRLGLEPHFGPVKHEWLYRIALKITETLSPTTTTTWGYSRQGSQFLSSSVQAWQIISNRCNL